jgi:hypothetical protein
MTKENIESGEEIHQYRNGKKCFIITPIGAENSDVRRKAEGVINSVLKPILEGMDIEPIIPHRMADPGSITQQVLINILEDDLVIANLTGLNPNVMYELAVRHATGKPVVCIVERGTILPFDISSERTIFYTNDMEGVSELKIQLCNYIEKALMGNDYENPIYRANKNFKMREVVENGEGDSTLKYMLDRLDRLAGKIDLLSSRMSSSDDNRSLFKEISRLGKDDSQYYVINFQNKFNKKKSDGDEECEVIG